MAKMPKVTPVDPAALRGLTTHAESHWLTFATAMRCYQLQPTKPELRRVADLHGPCWLRSALHGEKNAKKKVQRPKELDPKTGSLAFLTQGADELMKKTETRNAPKNITNQVVSPTLKQRKRPKDSPSK